MAKLGSRSFFTKKPAFVAQFRNIGGLVSLFLAILPSSYVFKIKDDFIFYRLITILTVTAIEEIIQR